MVDDIILKIDETNEQRKGEAKILKTGSGSGVQLQ